ncbi:hypothetical protein D3C85_1793280 [compost metagenome]
MCGYGFNGRKNGNADAGFRKRLLVAFPLLSNSGNALADSFSCVAKLFGYLGANASFA